MGYNRSVFSRIREEYSQKYLIARERAFIKEQELHARFPEIARIDRQLSTTGLEIFSVSLSSGDDYKSKLAQIREKNEKLLTQRAAILEANGYPADYSNVKYDCPKCGDTGYIDTKMCSCMREALILAGIENSGFSNLINEQTFENFSPNYHKNNPTNYERICNNRDFLVDYAKNFDEHSSCSILMIGGTGLGKTHLSSATAKLIIEKGNDVFYTGAVDLFNIFETQRFKNYTNEPNDLIERYYDCDLLIIDDLGTEMINQFSISTLYNLINSRLSNKKPVIISTNLSVEDIKKKYTDRITSRLFGEYHILQFIGTDVRRQKLRVE